MALKAVIAHGYKAVSTAALIAVGVVVVVAALSYVLLSAGGAMTISGTTTLSITSSASVLRIGNGTYALALASANPSHKVAYVYLNRLPAFMNPLLNITLYPGQPTKINAGTASANIELQLTSIGSKAVTLAVTPISESLQISPDSAYISTVYTGTQKANGTTSTTVTTSIASTTIGSKSNTGTTVTTVSGTNTTAARVLAALKKSSYYPLMLNYSAIYAATLNCTSTLYNTTYVRANNANPSGPSTFENVSQFVPYALYSNTSSAGSGVYLVVYRTRARSSLYNNINALTIRINASAETLLGVNVSNGGVFQDLNYTMMKNGYEMAESIGNACEAYVA